MRTGVFGGTFDPPHLGHLILASEAFEQLGLDRLLWVLTPDPPHKRSLPISPAVQRIALVQAAIQDDPRFELSTIDIDRPAPQYAVDTVRLLKERSPASEIVYLVGGDSLDELPGWHQPERLVEMVNCFGVMRRPGDPIDLGALEARLPGLASKVKVIETPLVDISATDIRTRASEGRSIRYFVPEAVRELIELWGLYSI